MDQKQIKKQQTKEKMFNILGFMVIFAFLVIGIILFLTGAHVFGKINLGGTIASYIFASIFTIIFILIIIKIILIIKSENKYAKRAIDVKKIFEESSLTEEEKQINDLFNDKYSNQTSSLNIYFGVFADIEAKYYKKEVDINSAKVRMIIQKMIIETTKEFGIFDVYMAIDFSKTINKKLVWKGDFKKYKTYFTYIRELFHAADDYIYDKYFITKPKK
ncbi:hypothetical protein DMC14_001090 [Metamycoplasma phocicerebrale]|uniref:Uncharacterized protein n=1 Tax=Metamycoplasma phocicerebrale TaxID=142649 RepID=A0A3T0TTH5_9BACT|nr:hypothetical protein [Metamycoplasma phocicerebrale]AZZ65387.1 hypothetical protein DMC14_001090 [Metamycoplasma phocicerebrale]